MNYSVITGPMMSVRAPVHCSLIALAWIAHARLVNQDKNHVKQVCHPAVFIVPLSNTLFYIGDILLVTGGNENRINVEVFDLSGLGRDCQVQNIFNFVLSAQFQMSTNYDMTPYKVGQANFGFSSHSATLLNGLPVICHAG